MSRSSSGSDSRSDSAAWAVDTSVAVAALDPHHLEHAASRAACIQRRPALAGHAVFETYSVLTRLPGANRVDPATAADVLQRAFPERCFLTVRQHDDLLRRLGRLGLVGGAVYDALVGESARVAGRTLITRDRRAARTYESVGVAFELLA
jgi:predicted nucleic acid-binding protein